MYFEIKECIFTPLHIAGEIPGDTYKTHWNTRTAMPTDYKAKLHV